MSGDVRRGLVVDGEVCAGGGVFRGVSDLLPPHPVDRLLARFHHLLHLVLPHSLLMLYLSFYEGGSKMKLFIYLFISDVYTG